MSTLYIRNVNEKEHKDIRVQAAKEGLSLKELILKVLRQYVRSKN